MLILDKTVFIEEVLLYPKMKQEYKARGWSWKHYYDVCGYDNRQSYRELFLQILNNLNLDGNNLVSF